ncbi:MAG: transcriptional repressor [Candidatus Saccharimonadales bacterium]
MNNIALTQRQTKYCQAIKNMLESMGHATNIELLLELQKIYPNISATTVHRATTRLASRNEISVAPSTHDGSMRYDTNIIPHDHFLCTNCGRLRDTNVKDKVIPILESEIEDCHISGRLTISGVCKQCKESTSE